MFSVISLVAILGILLSSSAGKSQGAPMPIEADRFLYPEHEFSLLSAGRNVFLRYRFKTFEDRDQEFSCKLDLDAGERLRRDLGIPICPEIFPSGDFVCWQPGKELPQGGREVDFLFSRKSSDMAGYLNKIGLHKEGEGKAAIWGLDYSPFAAKAVPALQDCIHSLEQQSGWSDDTVMAFLLSMPRPKSKIPEIDEDSGKWVGGFRVPTSVILEDEGDCDSKAVLFSVLRHQAGRRLVIFRSMPLPNGQDPIEHALVGIDLGGETPEPREGLSNKWEEGYIKPGSYDRWQPLEFGKNRRKYIPLELTGPGRTNYGEVAFREGYKRCRPDLGCPYVAIPIESVDQLASTVTSTGQGGRRGRGDRLAGR
jgi:hypothetical protein